MTEQKRFFNVPGRESDLLRLISSYREIVEGQMSLLKELEGLDIYNQAEIERIRMELEKLFPEFIDKVRQAKTDLTLDAILKAKREFKSAFPFCVAAICRLRNQGNSVDVINQLLQELYTSQFQNLESEIEELKRHIIPFRIKNPPYSPINYFEN